MMRDEARWWEGGCGRRGEERRLQQAVRLQRLGITEREFALYRWLFLKNRDWSRYAQCTADGGWRTYPYPLKPDRLLLHLAGEYALALPFKQSVNQIVIDIDCKGSRNRTQAIAVARGVISTISPAPIIYQSSESGGIRILYFLSKWIARHELHDLVCCQLFKHGITLRPGVCEVRLTDAVDRMPFGLYSMLLNPQTFKPRTDLDLSETLVVVQQHKQTHRVDPRQLGPAPSPRPELKNEFVDRVHRLLANGLPADETTTGCLMSLAWHYRAIEGYSNGQICAALEEWVVKSHNGNSERVIKGDIENVFKQIQRIVGGLRAQARAVDRRVSTVGLTQEEVSRLLAMNLNYKQCVGAFIILIHAKKTLLRSLDSKDYRGLNRTGTIKCGRESGGGEGIPNGAGNFILHLPLPKNLLRRLKVPYSDNPRRLIDCLVGAGLLQLKRKAWADAHVAAEYWVNFTFQIEESRCYLHFDQAMIDMLTHQQISCRFSRHLAIKIGKAAK